MTDTTPSPSAAPSPAPTPVSGPASTPVSGPPSAVAPAGPAAPPPAPGRFSGSALFALTGVGAAAIALLAVLVVAFTADGSAADANDPGSLPAAPVDDGAVADPAANPAEVIAAAATAMAGVESVEFRLERSGAPVFIDEFEQIALDRLRGQFTVPGRARAELTVTVDGDLSTRLGAVAVDDEVWISNPVTGDFETLPAGYDIDPSRFFDPAGGWQPLLANLGDVELVGIEQRGGERYHLRGVAPAAEVRNITVGLVTGQDVTIDLWVHPGTRLVTAAEFATDLGDGSSEWTLELDRYGEAFTIEPPDNVRDTGTAGA